MDQDGSFAGPAAPVPDTRVAGPPDWSRIPCAVPCARCGRDLRGLADPQCAACGLEFTWAEAVPLESLRCPGCGYNLYGLPTARCAECGRSFTWDQLPRPVSRLARQLIESRGRAQPARSFLYTWWVTQRSRWFWSHLSIQDPVRPAPLGIFMLVLLLFGGLGAIGLHVLSDYGLWRAYQRGLPNPAGGFTWAALQTSEGWTGLLFFAAWGICSVAALLLFQQSLRRARIRHDQLLRVGVYAVIAPGAGAVVVAAAVLAMSLSSNALLVPAGYPAWFGIVALVAALNAARALRRAFRDYLQMPHALGVAVAVQLIGVLTAWALMRSVPPRPIAWQARRALNYVTHLILTAL